MIQEWLLSIQLIICLLRIKQPHYQISIHGQEITGNQLTLMQIIQELQMISHPTVFTMLQAIVESHLLSKLPNQQFMDHNIMIQEWLLYILQITCLLTNKQNHPKKLDMFLTNTQGLKDLIWQLLNTAQISMRDSLYWMVQQKLSLTHNPDLIVMLTMVFEIRKFIEIKTLVLMDKNNTLYLIFKNNWCNQITLTVF